MNTTPTKIGFIPSSTPINHSYDSGYVGSEKKSVSKKLFHTLSPIKEDPLRTKKICNDQDSGIFVSPPSNKFNKIISSLYANSLEKLRKIKNDDRIGHSPVGVVRELNFNESFVYSNDSFSSDESKSEGKDRIVTQFPLNSWKCMTINLIENFYKRPYISSREKRLLAVRNKKIDIFNQLKIRNCHYIISNVLSHLSAQDLCNAYSVSKTWQEIVVTDKDASARRIFFLRRKKAELENQHKSGLTGINDRYDRSTVHQKFVLGDITNATPVSNQDFIKPCDPRFDSFIREGKNLQNGSLMKCPKCSFAAKKHIGNEYICTGCQHGFCKQCLCPFVKFHDCQKLQAVPITIIGSKKSKKNLRRL